ncbi:MAG: 4-hydroxy-tetrahydrodipicolinate synthase [Candidatus Tectomicrobia bacterium]|uniref:4-hydroxy-tetrahydrodipicolinate synthase n=1 Tax=Tectimicrobiota bacterium TaxID=2528274 RepID=A0A932M1Q9_UNCTE|nr:4-hydroxy-tetrahydrodipicolinate synthase [Candidatus Tectomicrobia bacterium]
MAIKGIIPAMVTPFDENEAIDEKGLRNLVDFFVENGVHGISAGGSCGEFIAMTLEERKRVVEIVLDEAKGRVPIYPGTGHYSTKYTIELSQHAEKVGAAGVMVILPYYMQPTKTQVMDHYRELARNVSIPIILYNNPWFAGFELSSWDIAKLVDEGVVTSVKAAHGDADRIHDLKYLCGDRISVLYGHDYNPMEAFLAGADGWLSGAPNVYPRLCRDLYEAAAVEKNVDKARAISRKMLPFVHFIAHNKVDRHPHWLPVIKGALNLMGQRAGVPRKPIVPLNAEDEQKLKGILSNMGLL